MQLISCEFATLVYCGKFSCDLICACSDEHCACSDEHCDEFVHVLMTRTDMHELDTLMNFMNFMICSVYYHWT